MRYKTLTSRRWTLICWVYFVALDNRCIQFPLVDICDVIADVFRSTDQIVVCYSLVSNKKVSLQKTVPTQLNLATVLKNETFVFQKSEKCELHEWLHIVYIADF